MSACNTYRLLKSKHASITTVTTDLDAAGQLGFRTGANYFRGHVPRRSTQTANKNETTFIIICDLIMILYTLWGSPLLCRDWSGSTDHSYEASHLST